jgi:L-ascorbate metabolism protein UlaG (beta-lactamase superfamily)
MATHIRFLGLAAFEIVTPQGQVVLVDPCLDDNPASPVKVAELQRVDLVLVTHLAEDHLGDTAAVVSKFACPVVCDAGVKYYLGKLGVDGSLIRTVPWGGQVDPRGIRVRAVACMHSSGRVAPDDRWVTGTPLGFILHTDPETRIYHSGDTAVFGDLRLIGELYRPNVGLLCCCQLEHDYLTKHGLLDHLGNEMSGDEGALAAQWLGLEYALCCHYLSPEGHPDVAKFVQILSGRSSEGDLGPKPIVLRPGETFVYPPERQG